MTFQPNLSVLPPPQLAVWRELGVTPNAFTLYGGTALALQLGHRISVDFDFFSNDAFDPDQLVVSLPYLRDAERVQVSPNTLTCRINRSGPVLISFFGALNIGCAQPPEMTADTFLQVASLLDIGATKASVVQKRAEVKDYLDVDVLIQRGISLPEMLAAALAVFGPKFNPLITMKALSYFDDLPRLSPEIQTRLRQAVATVDVSNLPVLTPYRHPV